MMTITKQASQPRGTLPLRATSANRPVQYADRVASSFGELWIVVDGSGALVQLDFDDGRNAPENREELVERYASFDVELRWNRTRVRPAASVVRRILKGADLAQELDVAPRGTPFQQEVWKQLQQIPYGETWTYAKLAESVGRPGAARAVGSANGANPISVVIPCHRVVGSDGRLTGYSGGVERKRALLVLEGALKEN